MNDEAPGGGTGGNANSELLDTSRKAMQVNSNAQPVVRNSVQQAQYDELLAKQAEASDPVAMLNDVEAFIRRYCVLPSEEAYVATTLWAAHTHIFHAFYTTPRLAILSAEMNSGKTRVLEVLGLLTFNSVLTMNMTSSYFFRRIDEALCTMLVDETDALFPANKGKVDPAKEDIRGAINAGYRRGATVGRVEANGKNLTTRDYAVFAPVALSGIKALPDTLMSRSIVVWMQRRRADEHVEPFRERRANNEAEPISKALRSWGHKHVTQLNQLVEADGVVLPPEITDRNADVWEPLLGVAQIVGGDWPTRAAQAAQAFVNAHHEANNATVGSQLLRDIRTVFGNADRMQSTQLITQLMTDDAMQWDHLTPNNLGRTLKPFNISSKTIRFGEVTAKGFERSQFEDAWERYL